MHLLRLVRLVLMMVSASLACSSCMPAKADDGAELYETKIRPILMDSCYRCHSGETEEPAGGLRLDTVDGMLDGGDLGPAVVAGDPEESLLYKAVCYDGLEMPPSEQLSQDVIADIRKWIEMGAPCGPPTSDSESEEVAAASCVLCSDPCSLVAFPVSGIGNWPSFVASYLLLP